MRGAARDGSRDFALSTWKMKLPFAETGRLGGAVLGRNMRSLALSMLIERSQLDISA